MIEFLLLDLDDTILDFHKAERIALSKTFREFSLEPTEAVLDRYHKINKWHWEQLELGVMTREQVLVGRFDQLFGELDMEVDAAACMKQYERNLSIGHYFLPGAEETIKRLHKKYRLFPQAVRGNVQKGYPFSPSVFSCARLLCLRACRYRLLREWRKRTYPYRYS